VTLIVLLIISKIIQGLVIIPPDVAFNAAMADTADQQELVNSKRQEGIFFASAYFSIKASYGIGAAIAGVALSIIGCVVNGPGEAAMTDVGITGGRKGSNMLYLSGVQTEKVLTNDMIDRVVFEVEKKASELKNS
jgi:4-hydroxy-3-methylbut-2-en-1-yl diphosphate synthase IspG/GcpE